MSQMLSPSTSRSYGLARVTRAWNISRAGVYRFRKRQDHPRSSVVAAHRRVFGRRAGGAYPTTNSSDRASTARLPEDMGSAALRRGSREPSPRATSHGRARLTRAPLHRTV